jgi:hypothetical protein
VRGVVRISGDPSPALSEVVARIDAKRCPGAAEMYGKLFREGAGRAVADAMVGVTEYDGFIPPKTQPLEITARDCSWGARTFAGRFGQKIWVKARGTEGYVPQLLDGPSVSMILALPNGGPVELYVQRPGGFTLVDRSHPFMVADLYMVPYETFAVSAQDGKFEITGVPSQKVRVSALLPAIGQKVEQEVVVPSAGVVDVELTIPFSVKAWKAAQGAK